MQIINDIKWNGWEQRRLVIDIFYSVTSSRWWIQSWIFFFCIFPSPVKNKEFIRKRDSPYHCIHMHIRFTLIFLVEEMAAGLIDILLLKYRCGSVFFLPFRFCYFSLQFTLSNKIFSFFFLFVWQLFLLL